MPTIIPFLKPRVATTRTITKTTAVMILPCNSFTMSPANCVVSSPGVIKSF